MSDPFYCNTCGWYNEQPDDHECKKKHLLIDDVAGYRICVYCNASSRDAVRFLNECPGEMTNGNQDDLDPFCREYQTKEGMRGECMEVDLDNIKSEQFAADVYWQGQKVFGEDTEYLPDDEHAAAVKHPSHYTGPVPGIEAIEVTQHFNFNIGSAIKYLWRCDYKGAPMKDLMKAKQFIDFEIERRRNT